MNDLDEYVIHKQQMGERFKQFRELVRKSQLQFEQDADDQEINEARINMFEQGAIIPAITFINYFTHMYGLNLNWLVKGTGFIFDKKGPKTPGIIYSIFNESEPTEELIREIILLNQNKLKIPVKRIPGKPYSEMNGESIWNIFE